MKASELRQLTKEELEKKLDEMKKELLKLRFQQKISGLENPMAIRKLRKDIARVLTVLKEKEVASDD